MQTIKDVFLNFHQALDELYDSREAEAIALTVLTEITDLTRAQIKAFHEDDLPPEAAEKLPAILNDLKTGKPVQYILGSTVFYGLPFLVNPAVLIPRPETEELVEWLLSTVANRELSILDIGTGSGCIAISIKKKLPAAQVTAIDISAEALHTARQNAVLNEVIVDFMEVDILQKENWIMEGRKFDVIVSNPPYITLEEKILMHENVTEFEPYSALFVPRHDPLVFYNAITGYAVENLTANGSLFLEINENFGVQMTELLLLKGFTYIELRKDMSGRDRMIKAVWRN